ncbi:MAG: hypothetical protein KBT88_13225 [Gammaproteobacteria bacterium]|nr:hypothetical protein [Gammaproteobacteria bacterium]MBQ0840739.1 hypothetical protein [Gammaproteobacteria bacterium]
MSTAIIELNDSGILCHAPGHTLATPTSPGYALLHSQGVITGEQALQQAWLQPQQSFNQYWYQLSLSPLSISNQHARHHADLAYAQLQQLYADTGQPQQMIFAMPSNTTAEHLGILLGLVKASPFTAAGLVDAAVAAASHSGLKGQLLHADIQLHTTVLSQLNSTDLVRRERASQYPDIALKLIHDTWAQFIADRFIREYRYDPLHTAAGEQQLHDRLPQWIEQLNSAAEIETELSAPQGNFRLRIQRSEFIAANQRRWQRLVEALSSTPCDSLLLSHRLASLPGVIDSLQAAGHDNIVALAADATIAACLAQGEAIAAAIDNNADAQLSFITALPGFSAIATTQSAPVTPPQQGCATHLLHGHRAYPLARGLLLLGDGSPSIAAEATAEVSSQAVAEIGINEGRVVLQQGDSSVAIRCDGDWHNLPSGAAIDIGAQTLTLIAVD